MEEVIADELPEVEKACAEIRPRTEGKRAMLFVGGSRAHHYQELFSEMGMKTLSAGYEFAHRDDYEGRRVLPDIKVDADSRNIEELEIEADPESFNPRKSARTAISRIGRQGAAVFGEYEGMMPEMEDGALVIDDISQYETDKMIEIFKPDIFCAGIKEKYSSRNMAVPSQAAAQLRLRRTLCRIQGRHQLLQRNRSHGQQPDLELSARPLAE